VKDIDPRQIWDTLQGIHRAAEIMAWLHRWWWVILLVVLVLALLPRGSRS
jgi:hypothetical protein